MPTRELPFIDLDSEPFWNGCKEGQLLYQYCTSCGKAQFYPRDVCATCLLDEDLEWRQSAGSGHIYSFTMVNVTFEAGWKEEAPYVVAIVELDEGFRIMTNVIDWEDENQLQVGTRVALDFQHANDDLVVPVFRLAT